jgi:hypothetical protein
MNASLPAEWVDQARYAIRMGEHLSPWQIDTILHNVIAGLLWSTSAIPDMRYRLGTHRPFATVCRIAKDSYRQAPPSYIIARFCEKASGASYFRNVCRPLDPY